MVILNTKENVKNLKRKECVDCTLETHELIGNCIQCGKIICSEEGNGPCLSCNGLVMTMDIDTVDDIDTKKYPLIHDNELTILNEALQKRNTLLLYQSKSSVTQKIYDTDIDWFSDFNNNSKFDFEAKK